MNPTTRKALANLESWKRGAVMLLFFLLLAVITPLLMLISLVGWIFLLFQGQVPDSIRGFGRSLAGWYAQTARYLTGDAMRRPFPFEDLDCPTDEPFETADTSRAPVKPAQAAEVAATAPGRSQGSTTATGKAAAKKASAAKSGHKKTVKKKAAKKKAGKKKAVKKKLASKPAAGAAKTAPKSPKSRSAESPVSSDRNRDS